MMLIAITGLITINLTTIGAALDIENPNIIDSQTPVDCWIQVLRPGGTMTERACDIEIGGGCYQCKNVTDAYFVDYASTCVPQ